ncbi:MAG: ComF family protein [bacterium]
MAGNLFPGTLLRLWDGLWPLLWPPRCALCKELLDSATGSGFCHACFQTVRRVDLPLCSICGRPLSEVSRPEGNTCGYCIEENPRYDTARLYGSYEGALAEVIKDFKFNDKRSALPALAGLMKETYERFYSGSCFDAVIPVPLHRSRLWERGFNQAADLARAVADKGELRLRHDVLVRSRKTSFQYALSIRERERNVRGAFRVSRPPGVRDKSILLIDDLITTGATVNECARVLKKAGSRRVCVLCLAGSFRP